MLQMFVTYKALLSPLCKFFVAAPHSHSIISELFDNGPNPNSGIVEQYIAAT